MNHNKRGYFRRAITQHSRAEDFGARGRRVNSSGRWASSSKPFGNVHFVLKRGWLGNPGASVSGTYGAKR
jgi:hypothetical protein